MEPFKSHCGQTSSVKQKNEHFISFTGEKSKLIHHMFADNNSDDNNNIYYDLSSACSFPDKVLSNLLLLKSMVICLPKIALI